MSLLTKALSYATGVYERQNISMMHALESLTIASTLTDNQTTLTAVLVQAMSDECGVTAAEIQSVLDEDAQPLMGLLIEKIDPALAWKEGRQKRIDQIEEMDREKQILVLAEHLCAMRDIYRRFDREGDALWIMSNGPSREDWGWYYEDIARSLRWELSKEIAWVEYKELIDKVFHHIKWYEILIADEFMDYFCNADHTFYTEVDGKKVLEPQFKKFKDAIMGLTRAAGHGAIPFDSQIPLLGCSPAMYLGYNYWNHYCVRRPDGLARIRKGFIVTGMSDGYRKAPEQLTAEQIAVLIMYPFWSRMGGSFETEFLESGRLKKYLLALKAKHEEEQARLCEK